ncbi:hypothetical protein [Streptomyces sp. NPDC002573]|uniref:hypothetical protein n=1 Tax=Streptomyces sp. NPDC002573 TaxID=3364651 RepID=UPI00368368E9
MSNYTTVDPAHLEQLARQFLEAGRDLSARIDRYSAQCPDASGSYGTLPPAAAAEEQHDANTQDMVAALRRLRDYYDRYAEDLLASAARCRATDEANATAVTSLHRS